MPIEETAASAGHNKPPALYGKLEERILARDQQGASTVYYELRRSGRPLKEIIGEAVRIHAPYTHVPYHERIDDGFVNFVNNDHCLLSARATLHLSRLVPEDCADLPMAQTIWYIPTGLDIWNQKILKAPGHYARAPGFTMPPGPPPAPQVFWPDQQPEHLDGPLEERLAEWMTRVHRGQVLEAYRAFLGLMQNPAERERVLAQLVFAGLIDVQDRSLYNRSYTTGHKSFRARATVELGRALGWENAHQVVYAGALDIAVGPRWYSLYEMACNAITMFIEGEAVHAIPYRGTTERERSLLDNQEPLGEEERDDFIETVIREHEPAYVEALSKLLLAGRSPRAILDALQEGAAEIILETQNPTGFSLPQHCYEYLNTLAWFWDNFRHPQRLKLLYLATSYLNQAASHQRHSGELQSADIRAPAAAAGLSAGALLSRIRESVLALKGPESVAWTKAYLDTGADRAPLAAELALLASRLGNDPHNQEIGLCLIEDYRKKPREKLLLACAQHSAVHRKYGDPLEASRRFGKAMGIASLQ